jgi:hypothetical protein
MDPREAVSLFNQANGRGTGNEAVYYNDTRGITIGLPSGYAALTPNGWTWTARGPEGPASQASPAAAAPSRQQQFGSLGIGVPQGIWNQDFLTQIRNLIMQRLQQASAPVDPNAPEVAVPLTAARDEATRQTEAERAQLAERAYAQGALNTDVVGRGIQQSNERNATALGTLRGNLVAKQFQQKANELKDLMSMALAAGDSESARLIQMQLAELQATVQRENIGANLAISAANQNANAVNF